MSKIRNAGITDKWVVFGIRLPLLPQQPKIKILLNSRLWSCSHIMDILRSPPPKKKIKKIMIFDDRVARGKKVVHLYETWNNFLDHNHIRWQIQIYHHEQYIICMGHKTLNFGLALVHRLRRWPIAKPALIQHLVLAVLLTQKVPGGSVPYVVI